MKQFGTFTSGRDRYLVWTEHPLGVRVAVVREDETTLSMSGSQVQRQGESCATCTPSQVAFQDFPVPLPPGETGSLGLFQWGLLI